MHWWYTSDAVCHLGLWLKICTGSKIQFSSNTGKIFKDKLQQGKSGNVINRDLGNMQHRPKAWDRQTKAYTYWRERDHWGWNGKLTVPLLCVCGHSAWKGHPRNDLYCVGWDVKPYSLTNSLNHKSQKQTYHSIRQIPKESVTKCSIIWIIHCIFLLEVYFVYQHACCLLLLVFFAFIFHKVV